MMTKKLNKWLLGIVFLGLTACSFKEELPDYNRGEPLASNEAVGVFRVIDSDKREGFWAALMEGPIVVEIDKLDERKYVRLLSSGILDNADSSEIVVKRMPSGKYEYTRANLSVGNELYSWKFKDLKFNVKPGEVFYVGDLIMSRNDSHILFVNNTVAVKRQLKQFYPELLDKFKKKELN